MLAINTPRGRESVRQTNKGIYIFEQAHPDLGVYCTEDDKGAPLDVIIVDKGTGLIRAVGEWKARDMTIRELSMKYKWEWLISHSKFIAGEQAAFLFHVYFYLYFYSIPDQILLSIPVARPRKFAGDDPIWLCDFRVVKNVRTRATINGGTKTEDVCYVKMDKARRYEHLRR